jgi:hypothetical protein
MDITSIPGCSATLSGFNPNVGVCPTAHILDAADGYPIYDSNHGVFFYCRNTALTSTTPMEPGGTQNFADTLLDGTNSWIASANVAGNIEEGGMDPNYQNLGDYSSG